MTVNHNLRFAGTKYSQKEGSFALELLSLIPLALGMLALRAWIIMLLVGAVHHSLWAQLPAFGYWPCVLLTFVLSVFGSFFSGKDK